MYDGKGILKRGANYEYCGDFSKGKEHGLGTITIHDENSTIKSITAQFIEGKKEDKGKIQYKDGGWYEGDFEKDSDLRGGFGKMIFPDTRVYQGGWKNNQMHGDGEMYFSNGDIYIGSWLKGVEQMGGKMKYAKSQGDGKFSIEDDSYNSNNTTCEDEGYVEYLENLSKEVGSSMIEGFALLE